MKNKKSNTSNVATKKAPKKAGLKNSLSGSVSKDIVCVMTVANLRTEISRLIEWEYSCNAYLKALSSLLTNTVPAKLVSVSKILAELYGVPQKAEKIKAIIDFHTPKDRKSCLTFSGKIAETEIYDLHLDSVANKGACDITLTKKAISELLKNANLIDYITAGIENMAFFSQRAPFTYDYSAENIFVIDPPCDLLVKMLGIADTEGQTQFEQEKKEDCRGYIYGIIESLNPMQSNESRDVEAEKATNDILVTIEVLDKAYGIISK